MVRELNPFSRTKGETGEVVAVGGAGIKRITDEVKDISKKKGKVDRIILEVGTNDISRGEGSEPMLKEYAKLLKTAKKGADKVAVLSVLPRFDKYRYQNPKILSVNMRLEKLCKDSGISFIDGFSVLIDRPGFYRDKLHLNGRGVLAVERLCMEFFDKHPLN